MGKLLQSCKVGMRNFQDTFEACKRPFIIAFSTCMTVPLIIKRSITYMIVPYMIDKIKILLTIKKENFYSDTILKPRNKHNCNNDKPFSLLEDGKCLNKLSLRKIQQLQKSGSRKLDVFYHLKF